MPFLLQAAIGPFWTVPRGSWGALRALFHAFTGDFENSRSPQTDKRTNRQIALAEALGMRAKLRFDREFDSFLRSGISLMDLSVIPCVFLRAKRLDIISRVFYRVVGGSSLHNESSQISHSLIPRAVYRSSQEFAVSNGMVLSPNGLVSHVF